MTIHPFLSKKRTLLTSTNMNDLFGEIQSRKVFKALRDTKGRFANKITSESDINRHKAKAYKNMYLALLSQIKGFYKIVRMKDEEILELKRKLKNNY